MRTGAIFARGSCRALKWMALLGVVFALGAGSAAAQAKPNKPVLTVKGMSATAVTLTWTVPSGGPAITGFQTQADDAPVTFTDSAPAPEDVTPAGGGTRTMDLTGATAGTRRSYRVGAVGAGGTTWSDVKHFTTENPPAALTFTVTTGDQMATLTWARVTGARYYEYNFKPGTSGDDFTSTADAGKWMRVPGGSGATTVDIGDLTNGRSYLFGVRAMNNGGATVADPLVADTPSGMPGAPTDLTAEVGTPAAGKVTVTLAWTAPSDDGGNSIKDYEYEIVDFRDWRLTGSANDYFDITGLDEDMAAGYTYRVRAVNDNGVGPAASTDGTTEGPGGPTTPRSTGDRGQITGMKMMTGPSATSLTEVPKIRVGGEDRYHVEEGDNNIWLAVEVLWDHDELVGIYGQLQHVGVEIKAGSGLPISGVNWVSWIDGEGDADFPQGTPDLGRLRAQVAVRAPRESEISRAERGSTRHSTARMGYVRVLLPVDPQEAENDAFFIEATDGDIDLNATAAVNRTTPVVIIEDITTQNVIVSRKRGEPAIIYEGAPSPVSSTVAGQALYTVTARPARVDLPLVVRTDLLDSEGLTVRAGRVALSHSSVTLNSNMDGTGNSQDIHLALPFPDGDRIDDKYKLQASVVRYALRSGGEENTAQTDPLDITVYDRHKLPPLTVTPVTAGVTNVAEGEKIKLKVTVNRNPANTPVYNTELSQYTNEELTVTWMPNSSSDAVSDDYMLPTVTIPERTRGSYTQSVEVELEAMKDDDLGDEMLVLDADVTGDPATNNGPTPTAAQDAEQARRASVLSLTITDQTVKQVMPKTEAEVETAIEAAMKMGAGDEGLNPDESFSVAFSALFTVATGYAADYDVSVSGSAVTATEGNGEVTFKAVEAGKSMVTVTGKTTMASSSATVSQTAADAAEVMFDVTVVNKKLMVTVAADPMTVEEGGTSMITATVADRAVHADDGMVKIDLAVTGPATLSADSITIAAGEKNGSVTLTATDDDDYDDETVTVIASGSGITGQQSLTIMVTDPDEATPTVRAKADAAAKIAAAIAKAAGGAEWMVGGMVAEVEMDGLFDLDEGVTATYQGTSSDADVVKAMTTGNTLMLTPMGAGMATITVTGADNAGGSEAAMVTHDATVILANLTMTVTVEPMTIEEGGMATITAKASRMIAMSDGMVKVNLSVVGDATLSAEMIEIKADSDTGTATLTSTDDEMHEPDGETVTLVASGAGIDGNMSFDIMVTDNDAASVDVTFTLSAEDMNLPEGESATLTATASAAVEEDTEIMIMRDGTSTAGADDYTAESIMVMAGETTGTTMVMAVEDNEPDSGSGSPEMLTLYGMVGNMQTNSVSFYLWDAAVPALPVIAQLLLAAFLAIGGYRRYLRR